MALLGAAASVPPVRKLGVLYVVARPWSPFVADQLVGFPSAAIARLPLPVGVLGSWGQPVAL